MKKAAFTMVELIFVIVILGILAAVAVPRLNASRDDAEITKFAANLATVYKDAQNYYLANGTVFTDETTLLDPYADVRKTTNVALEYGLYYNYRFNLPIGGKKCLDIYFYKTNYGREYMGILRNDFKANNPLCEKMYKIFAERDELKQLLKGQKSNPDSEWAYLSDKDAELYRWFDANNVDF